MHVGRAILRDGLDTLAECLNLLRAYHAYKDSPEYGVVLADQEDKQARRAILRRQALRA